MDITPQGHFDRSISEESISAYGGWRWPPQNLRLYIILPAGFYPGSFFEGGRSCEGFEKNGNLVYKFSSSGYWLSWRWKLLDGQWLIEKVHGNTNLGKNSMIGISKTQHTQHHFKAVSVEDFSLVNPSRKG